MQIIAPEGMGYDRVVTVFSPDGRLFQVQYAMEAVKRGATVVGIVAKDGIALVADKKVLHPLVHSRSIEKISKIDDRIGAATIGLVADGRKLIDEARLEAQRHKLIYDEPIMVHQLVKDVSNYMQIFTQYGGLRPFGVTILIGGFDEKPKLFEVDPSGTPTEWKSTAIGEGRTQAMKILESRYKESISTEEAIKLGVNALEEVLKDKFQMGRIAAAVVTEQGFKSLSQSELEVMVHGNKS